MTTTAKEQECQARSNSNSVFNHEERIILISNSVVKSGVSFNGDDTACSYGDDDSERSSSPVFLGVDVTLEAHSSLLLPSSSYPSAVEYVGSFPLIVKELLLQYQAQRILIRANSSPKNFVYPAMDGTRLKLQRPSCNNGNHQHKINSFDRIMGPAGISIEATFLFITSNANHNNSNNISDQLKLQAKRKFYKLLRSIAGSRILIAPLDSVRIRKNHYPVFVTAHTTTITKGTISTANTNSTIVTTLNVQTILSDTEATSASFGIEAVKAFRNQFLPCDDHSGILSIANLSTLSNLLMGSAPHSNRFAQNKKRGLWIDMQSTPSCFFDLQHHHDSQEGCTMQITSGLEYSVTLPNVQTSEKPNRNKNHDKKTFMASFSLGDVLTGGEGSKKNALKACPFADTTLIHTVVPKLDNDSSETTAATSTSASSSSLSLPSQVKFTYEPLQSQSYNTDTTSEFVDPNDFYSNIYTHDLGTITNEDGSTSSDIFSLTTPWLTMSMETLDDFSSPNENYKSSQSTTTPKSYSSSWGIERTVQTPRGVSNSGTFVTTVRNNDLKCFVDVVVVDYFPCIIKPIFHTVQIQLYQGGNAGAEDFTPHIPNHKSITIKTMSLHDMPHHQITVDKTESLISLELSTVLPPDSSLWITIDYDPVFLPFEHFPPDPNRGINIPPSIATFSSSSSSASCEQGEMSYLQRMMELHSGQVKLYSQSIIVMPPVPDMTMAFNVITFSSTFYAFIIGALMNSLVRKSTKAVKDKLEGKTKSKNKLQLIKEKIRGKLVNLRRKWTKVNAKQMEETSMEEDAKDKQVVSSALNESDKDHHDSADES